MNSDAELKTLHANRIKSELEKKESELRDTRSALDKKIIEIQTLSSELEKARTHEQGLEEARKAMLYMLEDINETEKNIALSKKEWEIPLFYSYHGGYNRAQTGR